MMKLLPSRHGGSRRDGARRITESISPCRATNGTAASQGQNGCFCAGFRTPAMAGLSTGSIGRRPKSAKAGNRGVWGTNGAAGAMGIWRRRECWGSCVDAVDRIALARILGVRAGANERIARCSTGFAVRSRGNLADRSKRVWCRARAGQNGALRCGAGSAMTAS